MNPNDRQRLKILVILVAVLVLTVWIGRQIYDLPITSGADSAGGPAPVSEAEELRPIEIPRVWQPSARGVDPEGASRNPFQYGPEPAPQVASDRLPPVVRTSPPPAPAGPPPPPPPPPIPFQFRGYATVGRPPDSLIAMLSGNDRSFTVSAGEVVMGRYRIREVSETAVVVEDLEYRRVESLPLIMQ